MTDAFGQRPFPRGVLIAVAALIGFTIVMVGVARLTGAKMAQAPLTPEAHSRDIRFVDRKDGSTDVYDVATGQVIQTLAPGGEGFIRGILRSMARQRSGYGVSISEPFHLARRTNGDLTLYDPTTGILLDLRAYGVTNEGSFAALIPPQPSSP